MSRFERIGPPPVEWGLTLCSRKSCAELAEVKVDGWPFCCFHADDEIERWVAFSLNPDAVFDLFPALDDRGVR